MKSIPTLEEIENDVKDQTKMEEPTGFAVLVKALDFSIDFLHASSQLKVSSDQEYTSYLMVVNAIYSLTASFRLMVTGYYRQAASLLRTSMEDWVTCHYLWNDPDSVPMWLKESDYRKLPKFEHMRKGLDEPFRTRWKETYGVLSELAHPRLMALLIVDAQVVKGGVGPYFDKKLFRVLARECIFVILSVEATIPWLKGTVSKSPDLMKLLAAVEENVTSWLASIGAVGDS